MAGESTDSTDSNPEVKMTWTWLKREEKEEKGEESICCKSGGRSRLGILKKQTVIEKQQKKWTHREREERKE